MTMTKKNKIKKHIKQSKKVKIMYGGLICDNPNNAAYMMVGHAGTLDTVLDVPDNCVYITTALCGTLSSISINKTFDWLFSHNKELIKNPCNVANFNDQFKISHHLQYGCVYTKNKPLRIYGYFCDLLLFKDAVLIF